MSRTLGVAWLVAVTSAFLSTGCLSAGYDKDYQARLEEYKRQAAGGPVAAQPADPPANADAE